MGQALCRLALWNKNEYDVGPATKVSHSLEEERNTNV